MDISIEITVDAPLERVWQAWTSPRDIIHWNFASDDWCCPRADVDLQEGGKFDYRMEAKDGSIGFDMEGVFTAIQPQKSIQYNLTDGRKVNVEFSETPSGVLVHETFEAETENSTELQRVGWLSILDNFRRHVENK